MFANAAHTLRLVTTNYFEPINEGVIDVQAWNASLTSVGRVRSRHPRVLTHSTHTQ